MVYVKYAEFYAVIPGPDGHNVIAAVPYQLVSQRHSYWADRQWSEHRQYLVRVSYHIASIGWGLLVSVHAEETLYWAYLIGAIQRRDSKSWFESGFCKIWVLSAVTVSQPTL